MRTRRIRVLADLHVGSHWGLWPPGLRYEGRKYPQTDAQEYLWECWEHMLSTADSVDVWVVNGDILEGAQPRAAGVGTMSTELDLQQVAALEVLRPAVEGRRWYCVTGTRYHEPRLTVIAQMLGVRGGRVRITLRLRCMGKLLEFRHHPDAGSGALYYASILERDIRTSLLRAATGQAHKPQVIVVSHRHEYVSVQVFGTTMVMTPCWQMQTEWAEMKRPKSWIPTLGYVDIVLSDDEHFPHVLPYTYSNPLGEVEVIDLDEEAGAHRAAAGAAKKARRRSR